MSSVPPKRNFTAFQRKVKNNRFKQELLKEHFRSMLGDRWFGKEIIMDDWHVSVDDRDG